MIIDIKASDFATGTCECGAPAMPGLFSVQHLGESVPEPGSMAASGLDPLALCGPCGVEAQKEHGYGVLVFRIH